MAWSHNPKPAKGAGHGGPAKGSVADGPAKGAGTGPKARAPFEPGNRASALENRTGGDAYRRMSKEERIAILTEKAYDLYEHAQQESVRANMIQYLMNREMGSPVAKAEITGKDGGPLQAVSASTNDPVEAARIYQEMIRGQ
jgi:hypothetical protein